MRAGGHYYTTCVTEFPFDSDGYYTGNSNLYVLTDTNDLRPYVLTGSNLLYYPRVGTVQAQYYPITSVELIKKSSFDVLPSLLIALGICLVFKSLRCLLGR